MIFIQKRVRKIADLLRYAYNLTTNNRSFFSENQIPVRKNYSNERAITVDNEQNPKLWDIHSLTRMEANIDDATPELLAHAVNLLLDDGAIDAWIHPIIMKKGRPAHSQLHLSLRFG